ncbi:MAG: CidA/LrgA family protein [Marinicella sp.]|nr:CidA/LrgA family protein [Xanthomonadales bacterium]
MKMVAGIIILVLYHQMGELMMNWLEWPIPGGVFGMLMMFITLLIMKKPPQVIGQSSEFLLRHLAFLFVPAGVGIMLLFDLIKQEWLAMLVSMVLSTFISLGFVAWLMQKLIKLQTLKNHE